MKNRTYGSSERSKYEICGVHVQPSSGDFEIPPDDWERFLETFSSQHQGWIVNVFTSPAGKKYEKFPQIIGRPLMHVRIDRKGSRPELQIAVIDSDNEPLIHRVPDPARIVFKQDSEGAHEGLEITSADKSVTSVRFRVSARPDTLDGILTTQRKIRTRWPGWQIPIPVPAT
jgi:hypothetical protein